MTIQMKKVWFVDGQIIEQEIPESDIYKQEPVAWISENAGLYHFKPDKSLNPLPLYLAPPPCPTCEALARTVMLDQTSHDTKRQWVGLTAADIKEIWKGEPMLLPWDMTRTLAIEAKLKEKNT